MIQSETKLYSIDNSGIKIIKTIQIKGGFKKRYGILGSNFRGSVLKLKNKSGKKNFFKKGDIITGIIINTKKNYAKNDGQLLKFFKNSCVITDKKTKPIANRFGSPFCGKLRQFLCLKGLSISQTIL